MRAIIAMTSLIVASAIALVFGADFASADNESILIGYGTASCAEFANAYKKDPQHFGPAFYAWAQGYMSGINGALDLHREPITDLGKMSTKSQEVRLMSYCDSHPLNLYFLAVEQLFSGMREDQGLPNWRAGQ